MVERRETVFVIDDDASVRRGLQRLISSTGHNVETFASADAYLQHPGFDGVGCIVLDLAMPECSGMDLQHRLMGTDTALPIVFLTGHGDIPATVQAMKRGAVDFLSKPVDEDALLTAIGDALTLQRENHARQVHLREIRIRLDALTPRELEVLRCLISGSQNKRIAAHLGIAEKTVKVHRGRVMAKLNVHSIAEVVNLCSVLGVDPEPTT